MKKSDRLVLFVLLLAFSQLASAQRLPSSVVPSHYELFLDPDIAAKTFSGEETIDVQVTARTREIVLNSLDLDISSAQITYAGKTETARVIYDKPAEMVRFGVPDAIPAGSAQIRLKFSGPLTRGLRGLYLSHSDRRDYAVTQFEGTYARMMFPCFDEPNYKATFDLSVAAANGDTAISNGHIITDTPIPGTGRHTITFSTSPKMSTYLVALAIGDWQCLEKTADDIPIRVCAVPEKKNLGRFALDVADHSIQFYNRWYGIKYPFGKLDMLAIPDYEWGGMENTASIFYRDSALLFDDSKASVFERRYQAVIIAHEIAHQWFGDLVTPVWWDDIWLNEGFATWMETKPIAAWHPEWHLDEEDAVSAQQIISLDSLGATRAIHGDPKTPSEIKEMFDGITYQKGGAVLSMLESYVGPETFRKGVNVYLQAHANGNATASDFWSAMTQTSGKPVDKIMPTFVMQPGVPMFTATTECANNAAKVEIKQQRLLLSGNKAAEDNSLWQIPVCMKSDVAAKNDSECVVVSKRETEIALETCPQWLFPNRDAKGYYRVAYSTANPEKLQSVAETQLTVPERIAFVEDAWAMTSAGRTHVADFMQLVGALQGEQNLNVLNLLSGHLGYIKAALLTPDQSVIFNQALDAQFSPLARQIGWKMSADDSDETKALRATLMGILGNADDPEAVTQARELVQQYLKDPNAVDGTLVGPSFYVAASHGESALYEQLSTRLAQTESQQEYGLCLAALASFRDPALAERSLSLVKNSTIRQQEYPRFFSALLNNPSTRDAAWKYLKTHWDDLAEKVTSFGGRGAVSELGDACSSSMREDVQRFFADHKAPGAERAVQQSLDRIDSCLAFRKAQESSMDAWLRAR
ncbi:MAG: M1 family metallopeptidase [Terriglobales bacterium]